MYDSQRRGQKREKAQKTLKSLKIKLAKGFGVC
jgi:hypothetical protein